MTDPKARYTHIVAESDYIEDFREGWEYALRHFIEQYKEAIQQHPKEEYLRKNKPIPSNVYPSSSKRRFVHDVEERREHELKWHV